MVVNCIVSSFCFNPFVPECLLDKFTVYAETALRILSTGKSCRKIRKMTQNQFNKEFRRVDNKVSDKALKIIYENTSHYIRKQGKFQTLGLIEKSERSLARLEGMEGMEIDYSSSIASGSTSGESIISHSNSFESLSAIEPEPACVKFVIKKRKFVSISAIQEPVAADDPLRIRLRLGDCHRDYTPPEDLKRFNWDPEVEKIT